MWKCSKCETLNQGSKCQICGEPKPVEQASPAVKAEKPKKEKKVKEKKEGKSTMFWVVLIGIFLVLCLGAFLAGIAIDDPAFILRRGVNFLKKCYHFIF